MTPAADEPLAPPAGSLALPLNDGKVLPRAGADAEVDVWWGGYCGWTMLPSFVVCVLLTGVIIGTAVYIYGECHLTGHATRYMVYGLVGALWACQLVRWGYRVLGYTYRLTTQRLFCWHGFLYPDAGPVAVGDVRRVKVEATPLEKRLGVGRIYCETAKRTVVLNGVAEPKRIAALIERTAHAHA